MNLIEKYPRPCFALCECGQHGAIILFDGTELHVKNTAQGLDSARLLNQQGHFDAETLQNIEDQINAAELPETIPDAVMIGVITVLGTITGVNEIRLTEDLVKPKPGCRPDLN